MDFCKNLKVEEVDPQMRNNRKLTELLVEFENAWVMGTEHLLNIKNRQHIALLSEMLNKVGQRYPELTCMIETCDAQMFLTVPALVVLYQMTEICQRFAPNLRLE